MFALRFIYSQKLLKLDPQKPQKEELPEKQNPDTQKVKNKNKKFPHKNSNNPDFRTKARE